jgi:hypothetical protein
VQEGGVMTEKELIEQIYSMVISDMQYFTELAAESDANSKSLDDINARTALMDKTTASYARKIKRFIDQNRYQDSKIVPSLHGPMGDD